jgi:sporulation protein YlmC with PRC-barrel domain
MRSKLLIGGLLSSVVIVSAFAQSSPAPSPATPAQNPPAAATTTAPAAKSGMWRSSKLIGLNVYNDQNEKLGDISEILLDKQGKVEGVIIGVGGFLGMGQRDIKVDMAKLKFVDEPAKTTSNATTTTTTTGAGTQRPIATTTTTTASNDKKWYPDHAVLSGATKDQLKAMPEFKYN